VSALSYVLLALVALAAWHYWESARRSPFETKPLVYAPPPPGLGHPTPGFPFHLAAAEPPPADAVQVRLWGWDAWVKGDEFWRPEKSAPTGWFKGTLPPNVGPPPKGAVQEDGLWRYGDWLWEEIFPGRWVNNPITTRAE
jgi:hypothetical protein